MKSLLIAPLVLLSLSTFAQDDSQPNHLFSVGTDGLGWSGLGGSFDIDKDKSNLKDATASEGKISFNYSYIFPSRLMLGGELLASTKSSEYKYQDGSKTKSESTSSTIGVTLGYNFNEDVLNSWWIKAGLGGGSLKEETKTASSKTDLDGSLGYFSIELGKRFNFSAAKSISYSPSIKFTSESYGGDLEDAGLESSTYAQINIIKFDLLF